MVLGSRKGHSRLWDRADLDTSFFTLRTPSKIEDTRRVHLEIRFNLRSVLLDFQSSTEKPVFEWAFAHPMIVFVSYLVKNSMDRVSLICKLTMKSNGI